MNKAYLVYRPILDYDETEIAYFVCGSLEKAESKLKEIQKFCEGLDRGMSRTVKYPYNLDLEYDYQYFKSGDFIDIKELDFYD